MGFIGTSFSQLASAQAFASGTDGQVAMDTELFCTRGIEVAEVIDRDTSNRIARRRLLTERSKISEPFKTAKKRSRLHRVAQIV